MTSQDSTIC